jgi:hypothetical protein
MAAAIASSTSLLNGIVSIQRVPFRTGCTPRLMPDLSGQRSCITTQLMTNCSSSSIGAILDVQL